MRKLLTDTVIRAAKAANSKRLELSDLRCAGLVLRVTPNGVKSFAFRFRDPKSGRTARATLGTYPDLTLAAARARADENRRSVVNGINPIEQKRLERRTSGEKTFKYLADRYVEEYAKRFKRSSGEDERNLKLHINPTFAKRRYDEITRADVIELAETIVSAGKPIQANRVQSLLGKIYSFALDVGLISGHPFPRLAKRSPENIGRRVLADDEIRLFWPRITTKPVTERVGIALRLMLLTGARPGEVAGIARTELEHLDNIEKAAWVLPAERSKNGRAHYKPLSALAITTIEDAIKLIEDDDEYLFPSKMKDGDPISGHALAVAMQRFAKNLNDGLPHSKKWRDDPPTPHDLRRTVATRISELGFSRDDRDAILNHVRSDVGSKHYDLYERAREKRIVLNAIAASITTVLENRKGGEVVPLTRNKRKK